MWPDGGRIQNPEGAVLRLSTIVLFRFRSSVNRASHKHPHSRLLFKNSGSGGIRTHASEETGALNQRLRPLGHATCLLYTAGETRLLQRWELGEQGQNMIPPRIELGTFCVLGRCDNRYTTESLVKRTVRSNAIIFALLGGERLGFTKTKEILRAGFEPATYGYPHSQSSTVHRSTN